MTNIDDKWKKAQRSSLGSFKRATPKKSDKKKGRNELIELERERMVHQMTSANPMFPKQVVEDLVSEMPDDLIQFFIDDGGFSIEKMMNFKDEPTTFEEDFKEQFVGVLEDVYDKLMFEIFEKIKNKPVEKLSDVLSIHETNEAVATMAGAIQRSENQTVVLDGNSDGKLIVRVTIEVIPNQEFIEIIDNIQEIEESGDD